MLKIQNIFFFFVTKPFPLNNKHFNIEHAHILKNFPFDTTLNMRMNILCTTYTYQSVSLLIQHPNRQSLEQKFQSNLTYIRKYQLPSSYISSPFPFYTSCYITIIFIYTYHHPIRLLSTIHLIPHIFPYALPCTFCTFFRVPFEHFFRLSIRSNNFATSPFPFQSISNCCINEL